MRRDQEPAPPERTRGEIGLTEVQVTIDVVRRPARFTRPTRIGRPRLPAALAALALVAGAAGGAALVAAPRGAPLRSSAPRSSALRSASPRSTAQVPETASAVNPEGAATRFGIRSHCVRRAIFSRDGHFARVDFDRSTICGAAGNHVTLILRRVRRAWVAAFDATGERCPVTALPRPVLTELRLCRTRFPLRSG